MAPFKEKMRETNDFLLDDLLSSVVVVKASSAVGKTRDGALVTHTSLSSSRNASAASFIAAAAALKAAAN